MASGNQHFQKSVIATGILSSSSLIISPELFIPTLLGSISATFYGPDIDLIGKTKTEDLISSTIANLFKPISKSFSKILYQILDIIVKMLTSLYAIYIPHRSWISHLPVISTIIRLLYANLLYNLATGSTLYIPSFFIDLNLYKISFFISMATIDSLHYAMDGGMIIFNGKRRYTLGKKFYKYSKEIWG